MTINFAWVKDGENFDPQTHCREDEQVFNLKIRQKEGGFALARITVANPKCGLFNSSRLYHCFISYNETLLFKGRVIGMPVRLEGEAVLLEFTAEPEDSRQKLLNLQKQLKHSNCLK